MCPSGPSARHASPKDFAHSPSQSMGNGRRKVQVDTRLVDKSMLSTFVPTGGWEPHRSPASRAMDVAPLLLRVLVLVRFWFSRPPSPHWLWAHHGPRSAPRTLYAQMHILEVARHREKLENQIFKCRFEAPKKEKAKYRKSTLENNPLNAPCCMYCMFLCIVRHVTYPMVFVKAKSGVCTIKYVNLI